MDQAARYFASFIRRAPLVLVAVTMCVAAGLAFGIPRLQFRTGQDTLLDPDSKISLDNARFQRQFGGDPMLVLFEAQGGAGIGQLFTGGNRDVLARLAGSIENNGGFKSVLSPLTILQFEQVQIQQQMVEQPKKLASDQQAADAAARAESARGSRHHSRQGSWGGMGQLGRLGQLG